MLAQQQTLCLAKTLLILVSAVAFSGSCLASDGKTNRIQNTISLKAQGAAFDVHFNVVTKQQSGVELNAKIDPTAPCIFVIHGFMDTAGNAGNDFQPGPWMLKIADSIRYGKAISHGQSANIILVDWSAGAGESLGDYLLVLRNVQPVGRAIAKYITQNNINPRRSILIGHSLGGHIAGAAGTEIIDRLQQRTTSHHRDRRSWLRIRIGG